MTTVTTTRLAGNATTRGVTVPTRRLNVFTTTTTTRLFWGSRSHLDNRNNTRGGRASAVVASRRSVGVRAVAPREEGEAEASAVAKQLGQSALVALSVMSVAPDAFAKGGELGILEGRTIALLHPAMMFALLGATGYIGYLGWQWRRVRTVGDEIAELKKEAKTMAKKAELVTAGAGGAVEESGEASVGSPLDATISELQVTRKKLIEGKFRDKHYVWGSLLLAAGVTFSIEGGLNTYLRTGKLFPGPHLFAGASMTAMWAIAAALTPAMQKGNKLARDAHIALNGLTFLLFLWQVPTGLEIVGKVFQFTKWP
ncbi:DUF4079 domain-containing protein [Chloropicon primus]|uniref:DUF4079 domain-containing protein n=1 Tax=Chloropicon primus TaxID=1764295 RepID=A0A5B8MQS9_9CHLO|nr:hypothetical protein A3770_06p41800 [Chloropicon primus]UPR00873.1 DUF4079 domain-containing protein [Chloropicon primus]|eukprot:QDZ21662.1 hypothetical protein A3770_06p41800 [Chloropicon primus]